jgi:hypothetical protein
MIFIVSISSCQNNKARPVKVFLLGGQSNMEGCGKIKNMPDAYKTQPENAVIWDNGKRIWTALGKDSFAEGRDYLFGPEIAFSHQLAKAFPDYTIAVIKTAGGGTTLWKHWCAEGFMYKRFTTNMENALQQLNDSGAAYEICGMLWMQGETDAEIIEKAKEYEVNLPVLISNVRQLTGKRELPFVMGRISSSLLKETPWNFDHTKIVQKAQENVAAKDNNVFIINTDSLTTWDDNTHFDATSQIWLGNEMGEIMTNRNQKY